MNFITGCLKAGVILTIISPAKKAFSEDPSVDIAAGILEMSFIEDEKMSEQLLFSTTSTGAPEIQRRRALPMEAHGGPIRCEFAKKYKKKKNI